MKLSKADIAKLHEMGAVFGKPVCLNEAGTSIMTISVPVIKSKRKHKYGAVAVTVDGHRFPSKREAKRYVELKALQKARKIEHLELQPEFRLHVMHDLRLEYIGKYIADFHYWDKVKKAWIIEDAKGFKTQLYLWKKRHCEVQYGITITEV